MNTLVLKLGFCLRLLSCILICSVEEASSFFSSNSTGADSHTYNWGVDVMTMAANIESKTSTFKLLDGHTIPVFGLGVYLAKANGETEQAVLWALKHGYRLIDTAAIYKNEEEVGSALKKCGIPREEIYVTTKLWNSDHGKENTIKAFHESLKKLGLEYIDLYLMHSPMGGKTLESWDAMIQLQEQGLVRSIGVSNFNVHHLEQLKLARPNHIPVVNQVELSPYLTRDEAVRYCQQEGIVVEAYSPLTKGEKLNDPVLVKIAQKRPFSFTKREERRVWLARLEVIMLLKAGYNKSTAQLLIRWCLERGFICIPKSVKEQRIIENGDIFDFKISDEDMQVLNGMNVNLITGWDPLTHPWEP